MTARSFVLATLGAAICGAPLVAAQAQGLRVGAAKVDVTPAATAMPQGYEGILDHVYARAIFVDDGKNGAALVSVDAGGIPEPVWR